MDIMVTLPARDVLTFAFHLPPIALQHSPNLPLLHWFPNIMWVIKKLVITSLYTLICTLLTLYLSTSYSITAPTYTADLNGGKSAKSSKGSKASSKSSKGGSKSSRVGLAPGETYSPTLVCWQLSLVQSTSLVALDLTFSSVLMHSHQASVQRWVHPCYRLNHPNLASLKTSRLRQNDMKYKSKLDNPPCPSMLTSAGS